MKYARSPGIRIAALAAVAGTIITIPAAASNEHTNHHKQQVTSNNSLCGTRVTFTNKTADTIAFANVPGGKKTDSEQPTVFLAPGQNVTVEGKNDGMKVPNVRFRIYTATTTPNGESQRGEMRQIFKSNNIAIGCPTVTLMSNPYIDGGGMKINNFECKGFWQGEAAHWDMWEQRTYVARDWDADDKKVFRIELHQISPYATGDYN